MNKVYKYTTVLLMIINSHSISQTVNGTLMVFQDASNEIQRSSTGLSPTSYRHTNSNTWSTI